SLAWVIVPGSRRHADTTRQAVNQVRRGHNMEANSAGTMTEDFYAGNVRQGLEKHNEETAFPARFLPDSHPEFTKPGAVPTRRLKRNRKSSSRFLWHCKVMASLIA